MNSKYKGLTNTQKAMLLRVKRIKDLNKECKKTNNHSTNNKSSCNNLLIINSIPDLKTLLSEDDIFNVIVDKYDINSLFSFLKLISTNFDEYKKDFSFNEIEKINAILILTKQNKIFIQNNTSF